MTQVVVEAERRDELPPTRLSPRQFQHPDVPTRPELKAVRELYQLSYSIASALDTHVVDYPKDMQGRPREFEKSRRMPEWFARVDQTVYRLLILGAALSGAYQEPFFKAREHPNPARRGLRERLENHQSSGFWQDDLAFLVEFTVYDLEASPDAQETLFGPVAEWLLDNILSDRESRAAMSKRFEQRCGRALLCLSRANCPVTVMADGSGSHSDAHFVLLELMRMLWLFHHTRNMIDFGQLFEDDVDSEDSYSDWQFPFPSAVAVFPGVFRACEVKLPFVVVGKNRRLMLDARPAVPRAGEKSPPEGAASVLDFARSIFDGSVLVNRVAVGESVPPLEVKFFEHFLRRHLQLRFSSFFFDETSARFEMPTYAAFTDSVAIFAHDDVENRSPYTDREFVLHVADFLDGSEVVDSFPKSSKPFSQPPS